MRHVGVENLLAHVISDAAKLLTQRRDSVVLIGRELGPQLE